MNSARAVAAASAAFLSSSTVVSVLIYTGVPLGQNASSISI